MTNEIEKKFFDAFGIKPEHYEYCYHECRIPELANIPCDKKDCPHYRIEIYYNEITDRILLELIEIIIKRDLDVLKLYKFKGSYHGQFDTNNDAYFANYQQNTFKDLILHICEQNSKIFYHQVRELFGEGEEE